MGYRERLRVALIGTASCLGAGSGGHPQRRIVRWGGCLSETGTERTIAYVAVNLQLDVGTAPDLARRPSHTWDVTRPADMAAWPAIRRRHRRDRTCRSSPPCGPSASGARRAATTASAGSHSSGDATATAPCSPWSPSRSAVSPSFATRSGIRINGGFLRFVSPRSAPQGVRSCQSRNFRGGDPRRWLRR